MKIFVMVVLHWKQGHVIKYSTLSLIIAQDMLTNGPQCGRPENLEGSELEEILVERGLSINGSRDMMEQTYRDYDLSKFRKYQAKLCDGPL